MAKSTKLLTDPIFCLLLASIISMNFTDSLFIKLARYFLAGMFYYSIKDKMEIKPLYFCISVVILIVATFFHQLNNFVPIFGGYCIIFIAFYPKIKLHNFGKYGDFSYGIYIYAFPVQQLITLMFGGEMSQPLNFMLTLPIVLLLSWISWTFIEKPCLDMKNVPIKKWLNRSSVAV